MKALLMRLALPVAQRAPPLAYAAAELLAVVLWVLRFRLRRQAQRTLAPFTEGSALGATLRQFVNVARYYVDLALIPKRDPVAFERAHVFVETPERLPLVERGGPAIFVSAHFGNPDQLVQFLTSRRPRFVALVERLEPPAVHDLVLRLRSAHGGEFVEADLAGLRRCLTALQAGDAVALVADRDLTGTGVCTPMAGRCVRLPRGPWELARRTGAPVIPVLLRRRGRASYAAWIGEPVLVRRDGPSERAIAEAAATWARGLEGQIRRDPGQWLVLEDFWTVHRCGEG